MTGSNPASCSPRTACKETDSNQSQGCLLWDLNQRARCSRWYMLSCFSRVWLFATPWTVALEAPLSMGFSRQEYLEWVAIPFSRGSSPPRDWTGVSYIFCMGGWEDCLPLVPTEKLSIIYSSGKKENLPSELVSFPSQTSRTLLTVHSSGFFLQCYFVKASEEIQREKRLAMRKVVCIQMAKPLEGKG